MNKLFLILFVVIVLTSGVYFFLISFGIIKLKFKTYEKQIRFEEKLKRYPYLFKISSIFFLVSFVSTLIETKFFPNLSNKNTVWTTKDKETLRKNCLENQYKSGADSILSSEYCDCAIETMTSALSKKKVIELSKKEITQQNSIRDSIIKKCIDNYQEAIKNTIPGK